MARPSKNNKRKKAQSAKATSQTAEKMPPASRRTVLGWVGMGALGLGVLGGGGAWAVNSFNRSMDERDLSRIGKGKPSIVQIHDPQCPICNALQRETRKALGKLDGEPPIYLIADITQTEGAVFAQRHSVPHVTLLLFDADGKRVQTLTGSRTRDELEPIFERHAR
jgi:hypothetical protein